MKKIIVLVVSVVAFYHAHAQTDADALRYSQTSISGTARFTSMAGAFGSLGGDFSSIAVNPAGLGIYRKSEFTISTALYMNQTTSDFLGNSISENKMNFNIPNFGFVFTHRTKADRKDNPGWKTVSFGLGLNRIHNFHASSYFEGREKSLNSLLHYFTETANASSTLDPFFEQLAYDAGLIYEMDSSDILTSDVDPIGDYPVSQRRSSTTRGSISEWNFSLGANYNNVIYLGGSLGIASLRYVEESIYGEFDKDNTIPILNNYSLTQDISTSGTGVNLKIGVIARPVEWVRIGASFHSPTYFASMNDDYKNRIESSLENIPTQPAESPDGSYEYTFSTPLKAIGSVAFIIGKSALISADYEFVDYSGARFDASGGVFSGVNNSVRSKYNPAGNLRVGGEYRFEAISLRAGGALYGSPFSAEERISGADYSRTSLTGGIGIRDRNYFIDLGYAYTMGNEYFQPYVLDNPNNDPERMVAGSKNKVVNHNFVATFGIKF